MPNIRYRGYKRRAQRRAFTNVFLFQPLTANNLFSDFVRVSNFGDIKMVKIFVVFRTVIKNRSRIEKRSGRMGRIVGSLKRLITIRQLNSIIIYLNMVNPFNINLCCTTTFLIGCKKLFFALRRSTRAVSHPTESSSGVSRRKEIK